jgi:hypothetical protein
VRAIDLAHAARAEGGENLIRAESSAGGEGQLSWIIRAGQRPGRDYSRATPQCLLKTFWPRDRAGFPVLVSPEV